MRHVLQTTGIRDPDDLEPVLQQAMIEAIARNQVDSVALLHEMGASFDLFDVGKKEASAEAKSYLKLLKSAATYVVSQGETNSHSRETGDSSTIDHHKACWVALLRMSRKDLYASHVKMLMAETKEDMEDAALITQNLTPLGFRFFSSAEKEPAESKRNEQALEPMTPQEQIEMYQLLTTQAMLVKQKRKETRANSYDEEPKCLQHLKVGRHLLILQNVYRSLLGKSFRYKIGIQRPTFDLFLW